MNKIIIGGIIVAVALGIVVLAVGVYTPVEETGQDKPTIEGTGVSENIEAKVESKKEESEGQKYKMELKEDLGLSANP